VRSLQVSKYEPSESCYIAMYKYSRYSARCDTRPSRISQTNITKKETFPLVNVFDNGPVIILVLV